MEQEGPEAEADPDEAFLRGVEICLFGLLRCLSLLVNRVFRNVSIFGTLRFFRVLGP